MRHITIKDIAKELGISKSTVSRALSADSQNVSQDTIRKVKAASVLIAVSFVYKRAMSESIQLSDFLLTKKQKGSKMMVTENTPRHIAFVDRCAVCFQKGGREL